MKNKLFIMAMLCAIAFSTNAQTEKGKFLLGGGVNFSTSNQDNQGSGRKTVFGLSPRIGYLVSDNWAVGTTLNYSISKVKGTINDNNTLDMGNQHTYYGIAPFVRYYAKIADNFKFFGDFNVQAAFGKEKEVNEHGKSGATKSKHNTYSTGISPGLAFFPAKKWAIEFSFPLVSYFTQKITPEMPETTSFKYDAFTFGLSSFNPSIGVNYHF
ncbi:outer membrane beta-barrel protein [Pedobacter nyackensis]|nr:outer membrane beta-barrel protein [Pedobacter nyackensis]